MQLLKILKFKFKKGSDIMLYKEWLTIWLENYVQSTKQRTLTRYTEIIEQHVKPALGNYDISEITPYILQRFVTSLLKSGNIRTGGALSPNSVNSIITVLQSTFKTAHAIGLTSENASNKIIRPKQREKQIECLSLSEQKSIEAHILSSCKPKLSGILLCLYTGLRIGELLALEWTDLDLSRGDIEISKTCYYGKDKNGLFRRITDSPKTHSSIRTVPLPKQLIPYFRDLKRSSASDYVISNGKEPISVRSYQRTFAALLQKLGISHRGFHALRHTFATRALECGMDVKTLSELLGHRSSTVTLNRYVHSMTEHKKAMMNKLGKLLLV